MAVYAALHHDGRQFHGADDEQLRHHGVLVGVLVLMVQLPLQFLADVVLEGVEGVVAVVHALGELIVQLRQDLGLYLLGCHRECAHLPGQVFIEVLVREGEFELSGLTGGDAGQGVAEAVDRGLRVENEGGVILLHDRLTVHHALEFHGEVVAHLRGPLDGLPHGLLAARLFESLVHLFVGDRWRYPGDPHGEVVAGFDQRREGHDGLYGDRVMLDDLYVRLSAHLDALLLDGLGGDLRHHEVERFMEERFPSNHPLNNAPGRLAGTESGHLELLYNALVRALEVAV